MRKVKDGKIDILVMAYAAEMELLRQAFVD